MKSKKISRLFSLLLVLALLFTFGISAMATAPVSENITKSLSDSIISIETSIPKDIFGGIYLNNNGTIVLNVTDITRINTDTIRRYAGANKIIVNEVEYSLSFLESAHKSLVPYMQEYGIMSLDANEVTNTLDIVLIDQSTKLQVEELINKSYDSKYVNITISSNDFSLEFSHGNINDDCPPEGNYIHEYASQTRSAGIIYPGNRIIKGTYSYTAGPKYSSNKFLTAGHAAYDVFDPKFYAPRAQPWDTNIEIGTQGSIVFGLSGDRLTVTLRSGYNSFELPSTNSFIIGTGTYSYTNSIVVGTNIEMHGAYSGVSSGRVLATNQTVLIDNTTVGNLARADYTCQRGDSGAGIFSYNAFNVTGYCYGTQSIGAFPENSDISLFSYFSQN